MTTIRTEIAGATFRDEMFATEAYIRAITVFAHGSWRSFVYAAVPIGWWRMGRWFSVAFARRYCRDHSSYVFCEDCDEALRLAVEWARVGSPEHDDGTESFRSRLAAEYIAQGSSEVFDA